ncbi:thiamine pyrophosphate-dependent dehydrogenase E1 component subunit alpha [Corynebacterium kroppenstedtii]
MKRSTAEWIYNKMNDIRNFEDRVHGLFAKGEIPGFVHLYAGEEAVAVGVCAHLTEEDSITSTHRGHGHCVAKGCDLNRMMAEIFGRKDGLCGGKGGSMHIADIDTGMLGANGMVGGGFALATGAALRNQYLGTDAVAVCFFGDGASNEGVFHEALNMAGIWKLPVVFVCENNMFGEATPQNYACVSETIAQRAAAYDMPGKVIDGKNVIEVYDEVGDAIKRARKGEGPSLIECRTYRKYGHFEGDEQAYKATEGTEKEFADLDPIPRFREDAIEKGWLSKKKADEIEKASDKRIDDAIEFAEKSPIPDPEDLLSNVFA